MTDPRITVEAEGLRLSADPDVQAHMHPQLPGVPETYARGTLRLSFPPDLGATRLEIAYRPPANPGDEPEVDCTGLSGGRTCA